jgi:hypothetical protein
MVERKIVKELREKYPVGTRVRLLSDVKDPYTKLVVGDEGVVSFVDDAGTIHVKWDRGNSLGLIMGEDNWEKI